MRPRALATAAAALTLLLTAGLGTVHACVGTECMEIWSTEPGGGALTIYWDFAHKKIQTAGSFCAGGQCLYSTIENGFITTLPPPTDDYYSLADGTDVTFEVVAIDPAVSVHVNGVTLAHPGDTELLGTAPTLHTHPSWQITVPEGTAPMDYPLTFRLTTTSVLYANSVDFSVVVSNLPTPTPPDSTPTATPTMTPTPLPPSCAGDCNGDGTVSVAEIVASVAAALGQGTVCPAIDTDGNGVVAINELIAAVDNALDGCPAAQTPTALPATFDAIQAAIFSPRCALPTCHDNATQVENLDLSDGHAYEQLVGVPPATEVAQLRGLLRIDAGHPDNSFLLIKLEGPPTLTADEGLRMPETGGPLTDAEIQVVRDWIAAGALR